MGKIRVALVNMGEMLSIGLKRLSEKLNSKLKRFDFISIDPVTSSKIGDPTIDNEWHDVEVLLDILREHPRIGSYDLAIGFTHFKMTEKGSSGDLHHRDYFAVSDFAKCSMISLNDRVTQYKPSGRTLYQYSAYLVVGELLMNLAKKNMLHSATKGCLFDECEDRADLSKGMKKGQICASCLGKLESENVSKNVIGQAQKILDWCRHNSFNFALAQTLRNPFTAFLVGTALGWFAKIFIIREDYLLVLIPAVLGIVAVFLYSKCFSK